jgi:hypothetical protein
MQVALRGPWKRDQILFRDGRLGNGASRKIERRHFAIETSTISRAPSLAGRRASSMRQD